MKSGGSGQAIALLIFLANSLDRNQDSVTTETLLTAAFAVDSGVALVFPSKPAGLGYY